MQAAMHVGVVVLVVGTERGDDLPWFLRGCGIIEIDKRLTADELIEDWEIGTGVLAGTHGSNE